MSRTARLTILLFLSCLLIYSLTSRADLQVSDEAAVMATAMALANQGNLAIDHMQSLESVVDIGRRGSAGHLYTKYFPGNIISAALLYRLAARPNDVAYVWHGFELAPSNSGARLALQLNALFGAIAVAALFRLLARDYSLRTAIVAALLFGLATDWWYQSRGFFSEVGAGTFIILGLWCARSDKPRWSSMFLAVSLLFRPLNILAFPIWLYAAARARRITVGMVLPFLVVGLGLLAYNQIRFSAPLDFGYEQEQFSTSLFTGLFGVLFSPGRSIFVYSPLLILALPGTVWLYRTDRAQALTVLATIGLYILAIALWHSWEGGWAWGSRLLTPIVPLVVVLVAPVIERSWSSPGIAFAVAGLAILGVGVQVSALLRDPMNILVDYVMTGKISYEATLYSIDRSWLVLQIRSLSQWNPCAIDAHALRLLLCR
jgi:hypothetical protein